MPHKLTNTPQTAEVVTVRRDAPPEPPPITRLQCPVCGGHDIREIDKGIRTNRMHAIDPEEMSVTFITDDRGEWEHDCFSCMTCGQEVELPDGWEIDYT